MTTKRRRVPAAFVLAGARRPAVVSSHPRSSAARRRTRRPSERAWSRCSTRATSRSRSRPRRTESAMSFSTRARCSTGRCCTGSSSSSTGTTSSRATTTTSSTRGTSRVTGFAESCGCTFRTPASLSAGSASLRTRRRSPVLPCFCSCSAAPRALRAGAGAAGASSSWKRPRVRTTFARHLHRPRKSPENIAAAVLGALALLLLDRRLHALDEAAGAAERRLSQRRHVHVPRARHSARQHVSERCRARRRAALPRELQDTPARLHLSLRLAPRARGPRDDRARGRHVVGHELAAHVRRSAKTDAASAATGRRSRATSI